MTKPRPPCRRPDLLGNLCRQLAGMVAIGIAAGVVAAAATWLLDQITRGR